MKPHYGLAPEARATIERLMFAPSDHMRRLCEPPYAVAMREYFDKFDRPFAKLAALIPTSPFHTEEI